MLPGRFPFYFLSSLTYKESLIIPVGKFHIPYPKDKRDKNQECSINQAKSPSTIKLVLVLAIH